MPIADWTNNTAMLWSGNKITDHGRGPLQQSVERIGTDKRMANGTLRRQHVKLKRTWTCSWENIPSTNTVVGGMKTVDGGWSGEQMESWWQTTPGKFRMVIRRGSASTKTVPAPAESALPYEDADFYVVNVMMTEFTKEVRKRGVVDLWAITVTLEEV